MTENTHRRLNGHIAINPLATADYVAKRTWLARRTAIRLSLIASLAYAVGAGAQTESDSFDVTVESSESQEQVVTQGPASLNGATLSLQTLSRISSISRARLNSSRTEEEPPENTASRSILLAALGDALYAALADDDNDTDREIGADFSRFGSFGDLSYGFGGHDATSNTPKHDTNILSVTAGVDYRVSPVIVAGAAVAYSESENDFTSGVAALDVTSYSIAGFGSWYWAETGYVDGILRYGFNDFDSRRRDNIGGVVTGNTDGSEISLSLGGGYDYTLRGWTTGPTARLNYSYVTINSYREQGSAQALIYDDQDVQSLTTNIGGQTSRAINTNFGVVLPQANIEWVHEFEDDGRRIDARAANGGTAFVIPVDALDSDYFRLGIGASLLFANGRMLFASYEGELARENVDQHTLSLGARLEF